MLFFRNKKSVSVSILEYIYILDNSTTLPHLVDKSYWLEIIYMLRDGTNLSIIGSIGTLSTIPELGPGGWKM